MLTAAAIGFAGSLLVLAGSAQGRSPFAVKLAGAWFFGDGPGGPARLAGAAADQRIVGVALVYAGVLGLVSGWLLMLRRPGRLRTMRLVGAAWALPLLVGPPLFSRDVYSYVAQGRMLTEGLNPYRQGPQSLGPGHVLSLVDPLWRGVHAPYGPLFERLSQLVVTLSGHDPAVAAAGFRLLALAGVVLIAWAVPSIAASIGRDPRSAFALAGMNPLILLTFVGGAHNDALMLGLL